MRWLLMAALAACAGCAPTTISPMVIRLSPTDETGRASGMVGLRTGPRLATPLSAARPGSTTPFAGDDNIFTVPQWGIAYDLTVDLPLTPATSVHLGAQGEFFYPLPLPGYGVFGGVSHYISLGRASIAPTLIGHFSTDFGISSIGGPGTQVGGELAVALGWHPEESITVGLVPFASLDQVWSGKSQTQALYVGGAVVVRLGAGANVIEVSGGFGRVFMPGGVAWNTPVFGVSAGR